MYRIQTFQHLRWTNAWRSIESLQRALEMQQRLEYEAGIVSRIVH